MTEKELLYALHKYRETYISGEELAEQFKVSRTSVWNHIEHFRAQGYVIEAHPNLGYRLSEVPDRLLPDEIQRGLDTEVIGKKIYAYEETDSTNDIAWELALKGERDGGVIFAESQRKGRGRQKRNWYSPKRRGIWFSVVLRPRLAPNYIPMITAVGAVAAAKTISSHTGKSIWIKWPNDIYLDGKKAGGILTEVSMEPDAIKFVVLGIGINVNISGFPKELKDIAVSVKTESRIELAREILAGLDYWYTILLKGGHERIMTEWKDMSMTLGNRVRVGDIEGQATGIDEYGALMIRQDNGFTKHITSGDVILCC